MSENGHLERKLRFLREETGAIQEQETCVRTKKGEENNGRSVCQDGLDWQKNPDTASVAGLWLPKQQWLFYDCQTVSFQEDGGNYTFTLPVGETVIAVDF